MEQLSKGLTDDSKLYLCIFKAILHVQFSSVTVLGRPVLEIFVNIIIYYNGANVSSLSVYIYIIS